MDSLGYYQRQDTRSEELAMKRNEDWDFVTGKCDGKNFYH